jgi:hypothetical protein
MALIKKTKDQLLKFLYGKGDVPRGLLELNQYFRINGPIHFDYKKERDIIVAISKDFRHGSIITSGKDSEELDKNIKDAILTSFSVPSSYAKEARIINTGKDKQYALA